jgi:rubrerythrin
MSSTIENLSKAFIGESQARNRYTFYAKVAKKEGFDQISEIFLVTADNEREHAKWLMRLINELKKKKRMKTHTIMVNAETPTILGKTADNLKAAIEGEHYETTKMYPDFAKIAQNEGFPKIAGRLRSIGEAEKHHEERFKKLLKEVQAKTVFKKGKNVKWVCMKCGFVHSGKTPPKRCPSCDHPENYFMVKCEKY